MWREREDFTWSPWCACARKKEMVFFFFQMTGRYQWASHFVSRRWLQLLNTDNKSVCSPSRGRVPDSSPWIVFCLFFTTTVQFTKQPSVGPLHYSGAQEPCQPIDALPPPLLQESRQPIDNLPRLRLHFLSR